MRIRTNSRRLGLISVLAAAATLLPIASVQAATPATWRIDALSNSTTAAGSTYRLNLQLSNIGDEAADGGSGDPVVFTASLPSGMTVEGTEIENFFFGAQHSEGITIPMDGYGVFDSAFFLAGWQCSGDGPGPSPSVEGAQNVSCSIPQTIPAHEFKLENGVPLKPTIVVHVAPEAEGTLVSHFTLSGAGAQAASGAEVTRVAPQPSFGIDGFDMGAFDAAGGAFTKSSGHPFALTTNLDFNTRHNPRLFAGHPEASEPFEKFNGGPASQDGNPVEPLRDVSVDLPAGLVGQASSLPQCTTEELAAGGVFATPTCPPGSQVGTIVTTLNPHLLGTSMFGPLAVYNLTPAPGSPATFGFNVYGVVVTLRARLRSESDYGISVLVPGISEGLDIAGNSLTMWGDPGDESHDSERSCPDDTRPEYVLFHGPTCEAEAGAKAPFLRMPTSCTASGKGLPWSLAIDSWSQPGAFLSKDAPDLADPAWKTAMIEGHEAPGYPLPPSEWSPEKKGVEDCGEVPFEPSISVASTTDRADAPTGLAVELAVPQNCWNEAEAEATCQSDLENVDLKLPEGMSVNPASAGGQGACSSGEIGLTSEVGQTPIRFDGALPDCPDSSKIGTVALETPLLSHTLGGSIYLAKQSDNPFKSLLALYLAIEDPESGVIVKLAGHVVADPETGRLETIFDENPQLPFENLKVDLFGGARAALRTPPTCGSYSTQATLTGWSGKVVQEDSSFTVNQGCTTQGFSPKLDAGTTNPLAGQTSPFNLRLTREDGEEELGGINATLPPGLTGYLRGIPYCPDAALAAVSGDLGTGAAQEAAPSCPAASQVGTVTVGAGAGANPFYTTAGRAYLAGPYKGAPLSIAVVTPAVAGPFDLGSVVVRNALRVDPETAQITAVSDPLPTILHGIPLDLRDVRVELDRPSFTLNPTSCDAMSIASLITSTTGATATPSERFQVAGCGDLAFKPSLKLRLKGKTNRGAHPALSAVLRARPGDANIGRLAVTLPKTELLENAHIRTTCTRVQFAAGGGGGEQCPQGSVYGQVKATSPLLDYALEGPVFLRSSSHKLPDLVAVVKGPSTQPLIIAAVGRIDTVKGRIRTSFETFPDTPISKVVLKMQGGKKGLLVNERELCRAKPRASIEFDGQNGKVSDRRPLVRADCGRKRKRSGHRGSAR